MANKRVYEVDLKVDGLISNYRKALQVMKSSGAADKTLAPLEKSLETIEAELLRLRQAGKEGILGDPNSLKAYDREVQNAYKRLERLGNSFQVLATDSKKFNSEVGELERVLKKANTEADKAQRKMAKAFSSLGVDSDTTSRLLNEIKTQEQLNDWIEEEKRLRQENLKLAGEQEKQARIRARQEAAGRFAANLIQSQSGSANSLSPDAVAALSKYSELEANGKRLSVIIQEINSELVDIIAKSGNLEEVWTGLTEIAQRYFITVDDTGKEITGSMDVDSIFGNTKSFKDKLSSILSQTEKFYNSSAPVKKLNELTNLASPFNIENEEATVSKLNAVFSSYIQKLNEARAANNNLAAAQAKNKRQMEDVQGATRGLASSARDGAAAQREQVSRLIETAKAAKKTSESFQQLKNHVLMFFSVSSLISIFRQQIRKTFDDVKTLDKSFASIAMVTTKSVGDMWQQYNQYADMAIELGQRTSDVIDASALFYQQGLEVNDALELTRNTMQLATLAGIDYTQATDEMTAAIRGFRMEMDQGAHVTDVYSTLAAHAAASVNDIAQAMVRTSSIANSAGMSFENTAAFLTQMIETTQESAENIGTSMKTIIARFTELKENVAGTDESEFSDLDLNRVDKALKSVGVELKDTTGQFRDLDDVFLELSSIWSTLDRNTQRYVATIAAGSRQQSRFLALMDGYERNVELINIAADSTGQADKQFEKYSNTIEYGLNKLATQWERIRQNILNEEFFNKAIESGSGILDKIIDLNLTPQKVALIIPFAALMAKTFIKTFSENLSGASGQFQSLVSGLGVVAANKLGQARGQQGQFSFAEESVNFQKKHSGEVKTAQRELKAEEELVDYEKKRLNGAKAIYRQRVSNLAVIQKEETGIQSQYNAERQKLRIINSQIAGQRQIADNIVKEVGLAKALNNPEYLAAREEINRLEAKRGSLIQQHGITEKELEESKKRQVAPMAEIRDAEENVAQAAKNVADQEQRAADKAAELQRTLNNIKPSGFSAFLDKAGGVQTIFKGFAQGMQQASSTIGMVATMMLSGAKATDTWNAALMMSVTQLIPAAINGTMTFADYLIKQSQATNTAAKATLGLATAKEVEAAKAAEAAAAEAAATMGLSLLVLALMAGIAAIGKMVAKQKEQARIATYNASVIGQYEEKLKSLEESMDAVSEDYEEANKNLEEQSADYQKLTDAYDNYASKLVLTSEEAEEFLTIQQEIAKVHPELIAGYNEQGEAILAIGSAWDTVIEKQKSAMIESAKQKAAAGTVAAIVEAEETKAALEEIEGRQQAIANLGNEHYLKYIDWQNLQTEYYGVDTAGAFTSLTETMLTFANATDSIEEYVDLAKAIDNELSESDYHFDTSFSGNGKDYFKALAKELQGKAGSSNDEFGKVLKDILTDIFTEGYGNAEKFLAEQELENAKNEGNKALQEMVGYYAYDSDLYLKGTADQRNIIEKYLTDTYTVDYDSLQDIYKKSGSTKKFENWAADYLKEQFGDIDIEKTLQDAGFDEAAFKILEDIQKEVGNDFVKQAEKLKKSGVSEDFYNAWVEAHSPVFESRKANVDRLGKAMGVKLKTDETGNITGRVGLVGGAPTEAQLDTSGYSEDAVEIFGGLGQEAGNAFVNNYVKAVQNNGDKGQKAAKTYAGSLKKIIDETIGEGEDKEGARDWVASYDYSEVSDLNIKNRRASYAGYLMENYGISEANAIKAFDEGLQAARSANIYTPAEITASMYGGVIDDITKVVAQMESHSKTLQKYSHRSGTNATIDPLERKEIQGVIDDLIDPDKGGLNANLFTGILHTEGNQSYFEYAKFFEILGNETDDLAAKIQNATGLTKEQKDELLQLIGAAKMYRGEWMSIDTLIGGMDSLISAFSSAASEQLKEGFLSSGSVQSLLEKADEIGLSGEYIASNLINDQLQLDAKGLYDYIDAQIVELEKAGQLNGANQEQIKIWQALKKELWASWQTLDEEAKSTDKVAEAWEKYNDQLKTVQEKQKAVNEEIEKMGEILYGTENRVSGLDSLYNYEQKISHFNNEIARSKELLSDAGTTEEATEALLKYSEATHDALKYEKARQETIRQGLADRAAQLENFAYSYSSEYGGASFRFGDYVRKDSATGLYTLNQTLLDRASFNDKFKQLLEEQVEEYNKYAEELLSSEDTVRKLEKEFQDQRAAAVKAYASMEKNIADALKANYQEEVDDLKDKYDSMKEADDDYLDALQDAIDKQRKLRERENKYEDLAKKEKKLSLISRDTSGANELQRRQLEEEIENDRENLLDEAIDDVIDGMQKLYEEQEENRQVEIELKEALIDNTEYWYNQAEGFAQSFQTAEDYMEFMSELDKEFANSTMAMREDQLNTWREEYQGAIQYTSIQAMDATSSTGDFIVDTVNITGDEIAAAVSETSSSFVSEITNAYSAATKEFTDEMDKQIDSINKAKDALEEAVKKLQEYADEAKKLEDERKHTPSPIDGDNSIADYTPPANTDYSMANPEAPTGGDNSQTVSPYVYDINKAAGQLGFPNSDFKTWGELSNAVWTNQDSMKKRINEMKSFIVEWGNHYTSEEAFNGWTFEKIHKELMQVINDKATKKYKMGGLVDYTGPAWVDGTKSAPEAFLNPEDTRRIGEAARILSDLPIFNSAGDSINTVSNTTGDISIEVNINVDKLSSEIDVNEMVNRVKDEIVSVARPVGTNIILSQNL